VTQPREIRAAIYLRISQDPNEDGLAVDRQRKECEQIARVRNWTVVDTYSDTVSASKKNVSRPSYEQMFQDFKSGRFDALICWDLDRLTRQPRQLEDWIDAAEDGFVVVTADGQADLSTVDGRTYARMKATLARNEIEQKGKRQKLKNVQLVSSGRPVPGRRRFGYKSDNMTPEPANAAVVTHLFSDFDDGRTIYAIANELGWRTGRVRDTLMNRSYIGEVRHQGTYHPSSAITPLVSTEVFERVQLKLSDPTRKTSPGSTIRHYLSGIARCGVCGSKMFYRNNYICKMNTNHAQCKKEFVEDEVMWRTFDWVIRNQDLETHASDSERLTDLISRSMEIDTQLNNAIDIAIAEGLGTNAHLKKRISELENEKTETIRMIASERSVKSHIRAIERVKELWQQQIPMDDFENWKRAIEASTPDDDPAMKIGEGHYRFVKRNQKLLEFWPVFWSEIEITQKRELVAALFEVSVNKGPHSPNKIIVEPKGAIS
jgi:DNA invertase Pin-like site-specific DNA recombinase